MNNKIFIDFDGVIYDTEKRIIEMKNQNLNIGWDIFFENLDWFKLLEESKIINDSIDFILEAQSKSKQLTILTKIHTLLEIEAKVKILRAKKIYIPILAVPPHIRKSEMYVPNNGEILIDDNINNIIDWKEHGGNAIYFNEDLKIIQDFETIKSLERICR